MMGAPCARETATQTHGERRRRSFWKFVRPRLEPGRAREVAHSFGNRRLPGSKRALKVEVWVGRGGKVAERGARRPDALSVEARA